MDLFLHNGRFVYYIIYFIAYSQYVDCIFQHPDTFQINIYFILIRPIKYHHMYCFCVYTWTHRKLTISELFCFICQQYFYDKCYLGL